MRELRKGLVLYKIYYSLFIRRFRSYKLVKENKNSWRCEYRDLIDDNSEGFVTIKKDELKSKYEYQESINEAIEAAIKRHKDKLVELIRHIKQVEEEIKELEKLEGDVAWKKTQH